MAETKQTKTKKIAVSVPKNKVSVGKLKLIICIVPRIKADFYEDLLHSLGANMGLISFGRGTATSDMLAKRALEDLGNEKAVIFSVLREDLVKKALETLDDKFKSVRNGKGIAFTVPFSSIIGASAYSFLADNRNLVKKDK